MTTVISSNLVITRQSLTSGNAGVIGYENLANASNITATSELLTRPITNVVIPATSYPWEASSASTQTITINTSGQTVDYIGIARHNLNQLGLTVTVKYNGITVVNSVVIGDVQAILFLQSEATPDTVQIIISGATEAPVIGVLYVGKALVLERNIYVGHTPITLGRDFDVINGVSENGQYLGEIVKKRMNSTSVSLKNLTPDWYRSMLDPFFANSPRIPAFWAWRPESYPAEVGYVWIEGNPKPTNELSNGMMAVTWNFKGQA
jgi:hypothetical protein